MPSVDGDAIAEQLLGGGLKLGSLLDHTHWFIPAAVTWVLTPRQIVAGELGAGAATKVAMTVAVSDD